MVREQACKISHKMDSGCDKRLARLISYVHHTNDYRQNCHVGNTAQHCRLGLFQDSDFAGDLEESHSASGGVLSLLNNADWDCFKTLTSREILKIRNPLLEEHCAFLGSRTFVPVSWMCKKHTAVSNSSTESAIISLDAGLRMNGLLVLDLWDIVIDIQPKIRFNPNILATRKTGGLLDSKTKTQHVARKQKVDQKSEVDHVPPHTLSSQGKFQL